MERGTLQSLDPRACELVIIRLYVHMTLKCCILSFCVLSILRSLHGELPMGATDLAPNPAMEAQKQLSLEAAFEEAAWESIELESIDFSPVMLESEASQFNTSISAAPSMAQVQKRLSSMEAELLALRQRIQELESTIIHCKCTIQKQSRIESMVRQYVTLEGRERLEAYENLVELYQKDHTVLGDLVTLMNAPEYVSDQNETELLSDLKWKQRIQIAALIEFLSQEDFLVNTSAQGWNPNVSFERINAWWKLTQDAN